MNVEEEVRKLREELESVRSAFNTFKGNHFTPDNYLRYESLPQLVGGVTHSAGSEEILAGDRWEYKHPQASTGEGRFSFSPPGGSSATQTILDKTETGRLVGIGVYVNTNYPTGWGASEWFESKIRVTIDGGTAQDIELYNVGSAVGFDSDLVPYLVYADSGGPFAGSPDWGAGNGDALYLPFNLAYETSIKIELVIDTNSGWGGTATMTINIGVTRGVLTT